jgi:hypothetical protein
VEYEQPPSNAEPRETSEALCRRLAEALSRDCPEVSVRVGKAGLQWRFGKGEYRALELRRRRSARTAKQSDKAAGSYYDEGGGILHLVAPNALVHLKIDERPAKLSPLECCLTAALCDAGTDVASRLVSGSTRDLARWFELRLGARVAEMSVSRLKRALAKTGVTDAQGSGFQVDAAHGRIGNDFRLASVGPALRFPCASSDDARAKIAELPPGSWIEGRFAAVLEYGDYVDERDFVVATDQALQQVRRTFGPPLRATVHAGPVVVVRTSRRLSVRLMEERDRPGKLHRLLAAADLLHAPGPLSEIGEKLWRTTTRSK